MGPLPRNPPPSIRISPASPSAVPVYAESDSSQDWVSSSDTSQDRGTHHHFAFPGASSSSLSSSEEETDYEDGLDYGFEEGDNEWGISVRSYKRPPPPPPERVVVIKDPDIPQQPGKPDDFGLVMVCGVITYLLVRNYGRMLWERVLWPRVKRTFRERT